MTRLEAIKAIRSGQPLKKVYHPWWDGVFNELEVAIQYQQYCNFQRSRLDEHTRIGPIHVRFWSGEHPHWIHIYPWQLLGWIKRTYPRH